MLPRLLERPALSAIINVSSNVHYIPKLSAPVYSATSGTAAHGLFLIEPEYDLDNNLTRQKVTLHDELVKLNRVKLLSRPKYRVICFSLLRND